MNVCRDRLVSDISDAWAAMLDWTRTERSWLIDAGLALYWGICVWFED